MFEIRAACFCEREENRGITHRIAFFNGEGGDEQAVGDVVQGRGNTIIGTILVFNEYKVFNCC